MAQTKRSRRGPKPPTIELAPDERQALESLVRRVRAPQRDVLRARIVLYAAEGLGSRAIAERLGVEEDTVGKWRRRFATGRVKALCDAPRAGRPPKFSAHQKARVIATATQRPRDHGVPCSHRNAASLARLAVESGIRRLPTEPRAQLQLGVHRCKELVCGASAVQH